MKLANPGKQGKLSFANKKIITSSVDSLFTATLLTYYLLIELLETLMKVCKIIKTDGKSYHIHENEKTKSKSRF